METWLIFTLMFAVMIVFLLLGIPISFACGTAAMIVAIFLWPGGIQQFALTAYSTVGNFIMVAAPLFILMAEVLRFSGASEDLYFVAEKWLGRLPGGIAITTVGACGAFSAVVGLGSAGTATMGLISLPAMEERKYSRPMATGAVAAGGALGIIIPPSIVAIIYGAQTGESIGKLFMGGVGPGLVMILLFSAYIAIRCLRNPSLGPPGRPATWRERFGSLWRLTPLVVLILGVLGTIYLGVATPTEAASIGAVGSIIIAGAYRTLDWPRLKEALLGTVRTTCMIFWIMIGSVNFAHILSYVGAGPWLRSMMEGLEISPWFILIGIQLILIILGMFLDPMGIIMITTPIFAPIIAAAGFDPLWFGIIFIVNMGLGYITPPFGFNLFILRGIAPPGVTMADVYRGIIPFAILDVVTIGIIMAFPPIATWLPSVMIGK